jgi:hypothetical protein
MYVQLFAAVLSLWQQLKKQEREREERERSE